MYNTEEYIGECFESILAQTFQNFEVLVVDDCSTDLGCEIVESYIPKFNGRLRLYHTKENSGGCAVPRNVGLPFAKGEYVFFMDSDDALIKTALEEMYTLAKNFDADVVYCEKNYEMNADGSNLRLKATEKRVFTDKPTLELDDLKYRVESMLAEKYYSLAWTKMVRKKLLTDNELFFPNIHPSEDAVWTHGLIFCAKKFLRVPNAVYIYRLSKNSVMRTERSPQEMVNFLLYPVLHGLKSLDELMGKQNFFVENPSYRYALLKKFVDTRFSWALNSNGKLTSDAIYETIKEEYGKFFGAHDVLLSFLCSHICDLNKNLQKTQKAQQRITELEKSLEDAFNRLRNNSVFPSVSVIVPMYNTEEYIGELLDSLLIQTFQDFEVIVADDCSTDNSVEVAKSYLPKFGERLKIAQTEKNSGGAGYVPRNIGLKLSRGEYVIFVDSDDFLLGTALETLYDAAKEYDAEVVYFSSYYDMKKPNNIFLHRDGFGRTLFKSNIENKTTFIENDRHKIFQQLLLQVTGEGNFHHPWSKFVRRDFLIKNEIVYPVNMVNGGDYIWCINVYAYAKRFLRLPKPLYFYRNYNTSVTRLIRTPAEQVHYLVSTYVDFLKTLNVLQNKSEFLTENPIYCQEIANSHFKWFCRRLTNEVVKNLNNVEMYELLSCKFDKEDDVFKATAPFFFEIMEEKRKELFDQQIFRRLKPYITGRIDIKFLSAVGDFQIVFTSDEKATVEKPDWLNKDGIGYVIQSYAGKLEIVAQATADGQLELDLKGIGIRNPKGNPKFIPYWIDYTKFTINDNVIFSRITPVWHNKAYKYSLNIKAGEEIKFQVEWLPHSSEAPTPPPLPPPPPPPVVIKEVEPIDSKFLPYLTSRVDVKFLPQGEGDFKIVSMSDEKATVEKPAWLNKNGIGYLIQSYAGKLEIVAQATADGQLELDLKGMDVRNPKGKLKRIPYWIDYTKLTVNGEIIFDKLTPAWHDKSYTCKLDAKAGEEITIQVDWLPHQSEAPKLPPPPPPVVIKEVEPIVEKFLPYLTARVDVKLIPQDEGDFQILSVTDENATVKKARWLPKKEIGYVIQSYAGNMEIITKADANGQIQLDLRSMEIRNTENKRKRVPYWIDYTKLTVNGEILFDNPTSVWYSKPYHYTLEVKAGDEIKIQTEWLPHRSDN